MTTGMKVGAHDGVDLMLGEGGLFWAKPDGEYMQDKTMKGLQDKITAFRREIAVDAVEKLPCVVLTTSHGDGYEHLVEGTFAGFNAHTAEANLWVAGKKQGVGVNPTFFRMNSKTVTRLTELVKTQEAARVAEEKASEALEKFCKIEGLAPSIRWGDHDKRKRALDGERQVVAFLKGEPTPPRAK